MSKVRQYFSVEDANRRLPLIKRIIQDIVDLYQDVHERRRRLDEIRFRRSESEDGAAIYREEVSEVEKELKQDMARLDEFAQELRDLDVLLKDPVKGLIDFPSKMDGRDVFLCWALGEDEVSHWHETDKGYAGRKSLLEGSIANPETDASE